MCAVVRSNSGHRVFDRQRRFLIGIDRTVVAHVNFVCRQTAKVTNSPAEVACLGECRVDIFNIFYILNIASRAVPLTENEGHHRFRCVEYLGPSSTDCQAVRPRLPKAHIAIRDREGGRCLDFHRGASVDSAADRSKPRKQKNVANDGVENRHS